jgi:hypothetical protein
MSPLSSPAVGQPVAVTAKPSSRPGLLRFETNRSLTGTGHERFSSLADAEGERPAAVLARRFFESGQVDAVHVYMNMVTVDLRKGFTGDSLAETLEDLYTYYRAGFVPPPLEMPAEEAPTSTAPEAPATEGGEVLSAAASRVPAHLLERSRLARERWKANQGG